MFHSLKYKNFRLFFSAQFISLIGTWMQIVAVNWLVYRMTGSPFLLGLVVFSMNIPSLLLAPIVSVAADRFDRRKFLILILSLSGVQAVILAGLFFSGKLEVWHIIVLGFFLGILNAYELPARQAFISEMVEDRKHLSNAIALNSSVFNASRLVGPAVAGLTIAKWGEGVCFILNALSFLPVVFAFVMMRIPLRQRREGRVHVKREFMEVLRYAYRFVPLRMLFLFLTVLSMLGGFFHSLLPVFSKEVFNSGPQTLGLILSFSGVGSLLGAFYLAGRKTVVGLGRLVAVFGAMAAVSMMAFAIVTDVLWAAMVSCVGGAAMIIAIGSINIIIQTLVEEDKRGRIMGLYGMALVGMTPIGSFLAGLFARTLGVEGTLLSAGLAAMFASFLFWCKLPLFRSFVRPVYVQKGLIPEVKL